MAVRHLSINNRTLPALEWPTNWPEVSYNSPSWAHHYKEYKLRMLRMAYQARVNFKALESDK